MEILRRVNYNTDTANPVQALVHACFLQIQGLTLWQNVKLGYCAEGHTCQLLWIYPGTVVVTNPPVGQLVAHVPKNQQNAEQITHVWQ